MFLGILMTSLMLVEPGEGVEKYPTAEEQLLQAKKVKAEARGTKGEARVVALNKACEAYGAVLEYWPEAGLITAEAAFRQGEIHRGLGRPGPAKGAFESAVDQGASSGWEARGLLEIGHIHRRMAEMKDALLYYERALKLENVHLRYKNDSREWTGKVHLKLGNWEAAIGSFVEWANNSEGPIEVVKATDLEVGAWIKLGKLSKAETRLNQLQEEMGGLAEEPTKESAGLARAIERMKSPSLLIKAQEEAIQEATAPMAEN
ncbi:MAG TPA: tetratricopeptide repeat protein [Planctomycetota bacterium]|jgi:tetratricopeptide (TPR) repeat protein|nr:hypothetical protein [Planctomycetota bacterium]MDP6128233.1 tetratricopeptide repeat protein [Planctomycetota bacterium]HJM39333.1 tetratricopeptide repeat protein [Planctomycetota bacterium]|tara:strand:+ start:28220 stop:29002 length:783 start_codon:yes stop_codon:yes gene_type:complete